MFTRTTKAYRIRFSLSVLLFLLLCAAGIFAGYRAGFEQGYASGQDKRESEEPYAAVYRVGELVDFPRDQSVTVEGMGGTSMSFSNFDLLMQTIQSTIATDYWEALGGPGTMSPSPANDALVVHATRSVHRQIETLLNDLDAARAAMRNADEESRKRRAEAARARAAYLAGILEPVEGRLDEELTPIKAGTTFRGIWEVDAGKARDSEKAQTYEFASSESSGPGGTIKIRPSQDGDQDPADQRYAVFAKGQMMMAGRVYCAATTEDNTLVLINPKDTRDILLASKRDP